MRGKLSADGLQGLEPITQARRLMALARAKNDTGRASLHRTITDLFERCGETLSDCERQMMMGILRQLTSDVEIAVRATLAKRLALQDNAPRDLVLILANEDATVAYDILIRSPVLRDPDLIEFVLHRAQEHQLAVAIREDMTGSLVAATERDVIANLLADKSTRIADDTFHDLVEISRRADSLHAPLISRHDMQQALAKKMFTWVSVALRRQIVRRFDIPPDEMDQIMVETIDILSALDDEAGSSSAEQRLVARMHAENKLSVDFALNSLRQGRVLLFELALAKLCDLRPELVRRLLYEPGGEGLAIVFKALDVDPSAFAAFCRLSRGPRPQNPEPSQDESASLVAFFESISRDAAGRVLAFWRYDSEYLNAVRLIDPDFEAP